MIYNFIQKRNFIFLSFIALLCISACSTFNKPYYEDFGYGTTTYIVSRLNDTVIKSQDINGAKIQGKVLDKLDESPFYGFKQITFRNLDNNIKHSVSFDIDGAYYTTLEQGTYAISFEPNENDKNYSVINKDSIVSLKYGATRFISFKIQENRIEADGVRVYKNKRAYRKAQSNAKQE